MHATTIPAIPHPPHALRSRERDVWADAVRAAALLVVVLGHWLLPVLRIDPDGGVQADSILATSPWTAWLTLGLQVMGAVFLVGGMVSTRSWRRARRATTEDVGRAYATWLSARAAGLLGPAIPLLLLWVALVPLLSSAGLSAELSALAGTTALAPLWFLVVYLLAQAAVPLIEDATRRWGWVRLVALLLAASAVSDLLGRTAGVAVGHITAFAAVWGIPMVLGAALADERVSLPQARRLAAVGAGLLLLLLTVAGYPVLMVGTMPDGGSNQSPPSLALAALIVLHAGLLILARPRLNRWLQGPRARRVTRAAAAWSMGLFLWHMTALCLLVTAAVHAGVLGRVASAGLLQVEPAGVVWWLTRPAWWLVLALWTLPLLLLAARIRLPRGGLRTPAPLPTATATLAASLAMLLLGAHVATPSVAVPAAAVLLLAWRTLSGAAWPAAR